MRTRNRGASAWCLSSMSSNVAKMARSTKAQACEDAAIPKAIQVIRIWSVTPRSYIHIFGINYAYRYKYTDISICSDWLAINMEPIFAEPFRA